VSSVASAATGNAPDWDALERSVRGLLEEYEKVRGRALAAERRIRELEAALAQLRGDGPDPLALTSRVELLEAENGALSARLNDAAERVRRLLARTSFLEEER
jgi:hypothetical protein